jgi:transposase
MRQGEPEDQREIKVQTVKLIRESGQSVGSIERDLDLTKTAVRDWVKKAETSGSDRPGGAIVGSQPPNR